MYFHLGARILVHQRPDTSGLRAAKILRNYPSAGHDDGIFDVDILGRRTVGDRMEVGFAVRMGEAASGEEAWSPGVMRRRTRPEDAVILFEAGIGQTSVIDWPARRGSAEFTKQSLRL